MKSLPRLALLVVGFSVTAFAADATKPLAWTVKNLGTLGGATSEAYAINASGQVVGDALTASGASHPFVFRGEKMQDLGTLPGLPSGKAYAINMAGEIVGWVYATIDKPQAFVVRSGQMRAIGDLGGKMSKAYAINSAGTIVAEAKTAAGDYVYHVFLSGTDVLHDLGNLGNSFGVPYGLNDAGVVVGGSSNRMPFIFESGKMIELKNSGHQQGRATAINPTGDIVGSVGDMTPVSSDHAFLYQDGSFHDLGTLGGNYPTSNASAINARGQIVGRSEFQPPEGKGDSSKAFLFSDGQMKDLAGLVGKDQLAEAGFKALLTATGINDRGQIVGTGVDLKGNQRAYLLTPTEAK